MTIAPRCPSVQERLGARYPIFAFSHSIDVVVEVCRAGGIGVYGATRSFPDEIAAALTEVRARVAHRPFGVDLVLPRGMPDQNDRPAIEAQIPTQHHDFVRALGERFGVPAATEPGARSRFVRSAEMASAQIEAVLNSDVDLFAMGIGSPPDAVRRAHGEGKVIVSLVGTPEHARTALEAGADLLVAQGYDAGAHTGTIGTFSLVPQVVDVAGEVPVLAAGGVSTGRHIAASQALGAQGVWIGTAWLFTEENHTHPLTLAKLLRAGSNDTVISRADSGKTLRQVRSDWSDAWSAEDAPTPLRMPYQDILVGDLLGAIDQHEVEPLMHSPAGQGVAYFDSLRTVAETMADLVAQAERAGMSWGPLPSVPRR